MGLSETVNRDGVTLTLTADRAKVRVAEPLRLTVEVQAPADLEVELSDVPDLLAETFVVDDEGNLEVTREGETQHLRQTFEIESYLSGRREIPGVSVAWGEEQITTAPLTVEVVSAIEDEGDFDPKRFADIEGPLVVAQPRRWLAAYVAVGAALALAVLIWVLLRRRSGGQVVAAPPPPHVWALGQLDELLAARLVERGMVQEFYYRLSGVVRTYIELRFGLMAPERTTEEFLVEVQRSDALRFGHKDLLGEFLTACDLVKFARHEPRGAEIDASIGAARSFVEQTAPGGAGAVQEAAA